MPSITLTFDNPVQDSVQVGDIAYYTSTGTTGGFLTGGSIVEMGSITAIGEYSITCNISASTTRPSANDFILFSKDNRVNVASITGYFAEVNLTNDSTTEAEVFHVSGEIVISSQ
jgi:hypothetical protein